MNEPVHGYFTSFAKRAAAFGIDEHLFKHDSRLNTRRFVTMIVDHKNSRLMEVVEGKEGAVLKAALEHIPGRENAGFSALAHPGRGI